MQTIDTLIHARWIIPVEPDSCVLEHHALAIDRGRILAVLDTIEATARYQPRETVSLPNHALIPGLVNAHTHAAMSLFRGLADDLPLMDWLQQHVWPAEARWVNPEFVHDGTQLAMAEMIRGGTTCFNDMYFFPDATARAAHTAGIRACIGLILIDFPSAWAATPEEYLHKGLQLHDELKHHPLIVTALAPHAPYTVADSSLEKVRMYADELDLPVHMHVHETAHEVEQAQSVNGRRPLERLAELGLLSPRLLAVHMTQIVDGEFAALAQANVNVVHCPESNLKLGSGVCPVPKLLGLGVNVALGTDGAASNNDLDMLGEIRTAALLAKGANLDPTTLPARTALRLATLNGAKALGLDAETGSLIPGKSADLAAIDLSSLATEPVYDPISQIVYSATRDQVSDVWVAGRRLLAKQSLTTLDEVDIRQKARAWRDKIKSADMRTSS